MGKKYRNTLKAFFHRNSHKKIYIFLNNKTTHSDL